MSQVYLLAHDIQTLLTELDTDFITIFLDGHYDHSSKGELMLSRKSDKKLTKVCACLVCNGFFHPIAI